MKFELSQFDGIGDFSSQKKKLRAIMVQHNFIWLWTIKALDPAQSPMFRRKKCKRVLTQSLFCIWLIMYSGRLMEKRLHLGPGTSQMNCSWPIHSQIEYCLKKGSLASKWILVIMLNRTWMISKEFKILQLRLMKKRLVMRVKPSFC